VDHSYVPAKLRPLPTFPQPSRTREFVIGSVTDASGGITGWTFNGKRFDPARMDADPVLGSTESWTFINTTSQPHAIHLHDVDWLITERFTVTVAGDGTPARGDPVVIPAHERGLKEVFVLPPREGMSVKTTFTDHTGMFMFHCHMLEHEDFGLMGQFDVVKADHHHH
jgi:FtsP/CotA-like multicopper oxidase with cupredoxin domain